MGCHLVNHHLILLPPSHTVSNQDLLLAVLLDLADETISLAISSPVVVVMALGNEVMLSLAQKLYSV
jgi:hypothetical protein